MRVTLINSPRLTAESMAQHAARTCYEAELPGRGMKKRPTVRGQLFGSGHHTTLEHGNYTFSVEGCSVGDVTFGFHYTTPWYNTDQRSGRYTSDMFNASGISRISDLLDTVYPESSAADRKMVLDFVEEGMVLFHENMPIATQEAAQLIREERPRASEKFIENNAKKLAQEQLRVAIPVIFPTAFYYTVDLVTLVTQYRAAWKPGMRLVLQKMVELVLAEDPKIGYMFGDIGELNKEPEFIGTSCKPVHDPISVVLDVDPYYGDPPPREDIHPIDFLPVKPEYLDLRTLNLRTCETMSVMTMGQDQRHRSVKRSEAKFTGEIYVPPIAQAIGMEKGIVQVQRNWMGLRDSLDPSLHVNLAPYGAMVTYVKSSDFASAIHDLSKRSCMKAQQEHFNKDIQIAPQIELLYPGHMLPRAMVPPCYGCKVCGEGDPCGRDMTTQDRGENYFPRRRV